MGHFGVIFRPIWGIRRPRIHGSEGFWDLDGESWGPNMGFRGVRNGVRNRVFRGQIWGQKHSGPGQVLDRGTRDPVLRALWMRYLGSRTPIPGSEVVRGVPNGSNLVDLGVPKWSILAISGIRGFWTGLARNRLGDHQKE